MSSPVGNDVLHIGSRAMWTSEHGNEYCTVRWYGSLPDDETGEVMVGVEFDNPIGTGTGKYRDTRLFYTKHGHASLVPLTCLIRVDSQGGVSVGEPRTPDLEYRVEEREAVPVDFLQQMGLKDPVDESGVDSMYLTSKYQEVIMAAASAASSSELPECPVCHDGYKEPKILPCTHLVCKKCAVSWLQKAGVKGGCPLCRAPILPSTSQGQRDLDTLVNDLPTDLATMALVDSHKMLSGQHVCMVCDDNTAATSFCLQCDVKLCKKCSKGHAKFPSMKNHQVEDLNKLTPQRLAEVNRATCNVHDDRPAEVYCSSHRELICMLCATTNHRSCAEVKAIPDVATEKRRELEQRAQRLRGRATALAAQIDESKDILKVMQKKANDTFDDLEQCMTKRRQEVNTLLQAEEDAAMTSLAELEKWRAALALNAASVGNVVQSASGGALLGMMEGLTSRLDDLESQTETTPKMEVTDLTLSFQKLDELKADIASLGQIRKPTTTLTTLHQPTQPVPLKTTATSATTPRTAHKPRGAELARVLKVGDRVKLNPEVFSSSAERAMKGTVTAIPSRQAPQWGDDPQGTVYVTWDGGYEGSCRMGRHGLYHLDLL